MGYPDLGLDRREGVSSNDGVATCQSVEEGGLAGVRETDEAHKIHGIDRTAFAGWSEAEVLVAPTGRPQRREANRS